VYIETKNYMKSLFLILISIPIITFSQKDTLVLESNQIRFALPANDSYQVIYEFIEKFDSTLSDEVIYQNFKYSLSVITKQASIGLTNPLFKAYTSSDPMLFEDKESRHVIFQFMSRTLKNSDDPEEIVPDMVVLSKIDIRVKNHKARIIFKDIDCYFSSAGLAFVGGAENSLVNYNFNKFADPYGENQLKIKDGVYQLNNYMAKRLFTIDYKLKYKIYPFLINEVKKNIKENDF
jgi:hypothetical protein